MEQEERNYIIEKITSLKEYQEKRSIKFAKVFYPLALSLQGAMVAIGDISTSRCIVIALITFFQNIPEAQRRDIEVLKNSLELKLGLEEFTTNEEKIEFLDNEYAKILKIQNKTFYKLFINIISLACILATSKLLPNEYKDLGISIPALLGAIAGCSLSRLLTNINNYYIDNLNMDRMLLQKDLLLRKRDK